MSQDIQGFPDMDMIAASAASSPNGQAFLAALAAANPGASSPGSGLTGFGLNGPVGAGASTVGSGLTSFGLDGPAGVAATPFEGAAATTTPFAATTAPAIGDTNPGLQAQQQAQFDANIAGIQAAQTPFAQTPFGQTPFAQAPGLDVPIAQPNFGPAELGLPGLPADLAAAPPPVAQPATSLFSGFGSYLQESGEALGRIPGDLYSLGKDFVDNPLRTLGSLGPSLLGLGLPGQFGIPSVAAEAGAGAEVAGAGARLIPGFSATESAVIGEAQAALRSDGFAALRQAFEAGVPAEVNIGGRTVQYVPDLPAGYSGMTLFGENGFIMGPDAFATSEEAAKTVLQELYRLGSGQAASGVAGADIAAQTQAAHTFVDRAYGVLGQ